MKIALLGYGKMGNTIERLAIQKGHEIVLKINSANKSDLSLANLRKADVAIEFSTPKTVAEHVLQCFKANIPVVIGTTAWSEHKDQLENQCKLSQGAMLSASNFSLGVNLFFELNRKLAMLMEQYPCYKVALTEIHHTAKLDSPSGTAISLAEDIVQQNTSYTGWENSSTAEAPVLSIESIREPEVPGTHTIKYTSNEDIIEIKHTAINREGFAHGALLAAEWIKGKKGIYTMKNVLNL